MWTKARQEFRLFYQVCFVMQCYFCQPFIPRKSFETYFRPEPYTNFGYWVNPSHGKIWPKPKVFKTYDTNFTLDHNSFKFELSDTARDCSIILNAVERYKERVFTGVEFLQLASHSEIQDTKNHSAIALQSIFLHLVKNQGCELIPHLSMDESYTIEVHLENDDVKSEIKASSSWGILRGLESFSQMVKLGDKSFTLQAVKVEDGPRFSHRGLMIDSSRHFLSKQVILDNLDLMEMNKMNVLHWHLTDDQSFPFESQVFPQLSLKGAVHPQNVYKREDVKEILQAATDRGIRVIPEFDVPVKTMFATGETVGLAEWIIDDSCHPKSGHTRAWGKGMPELLINCTRFSVPADADNQFGPMNPISEKVFEILKLFFNETKAVFFDEFAHLGGDEVEATCWSKSEEIIEYFKILRNTTAKYLSLPDLRSLESNFFQNVQQIFNAEPNKKRTIVWEDAFNGNKQKLDPSTVIEVWQDFGPGWKFKLAEVTKEGFNAILSAPWYLAEAQFGSDWVKRYFMDPHDFVGNTSQKALVLGGEACIWGEFINSNNLIVKAWPETSAVAERLWSDKSVIKSADEAVDRFQEHECRMMERGYPVAPLVGSSYCNVFWENHQAGLRKKLFEDAEVSTLSGISFVIPDFSGAMTRISYKEYTFYYLIPVVVVIGIFATLAVRGLRRK